MHIDTESVMLNSFSYQDDESNFSEGFITSESCSQKNVKNEKEERGLDYRRFNGGLKE